MVTKDELVKKLNAYTDEVEQKKVRETEERKRLTIDLCNKGLSTEMEHRAETGFRNIAIHTAIFGSEARECVTQLQKDNSVWGRYEKVRELHMPTLIDYVKKHGLTVDEVDNSYCMGDKQWKHGKTYVIQWA